MLTSGSKPFSDTARGLSVDTPQPTSIAIPKSSPNIEDEIEKNVEEILTKILQDLVKEVDQESSHRVKGSSS